LNLTRQEQQMLEGKHGEAKAVAMRLLVTLGEIFEAERMVPVNSVQVSGVSFKTIGEPGLQYLEDLSNKGARSTINATTNPAGMDLRRWRRLGVPEHFAKKQLRIVSAFKKMKISTACTCIPYFAGNKPKLGAHIAWAESSAVTFANSVIGARTNREGGPGALASAIVGRTPLYGLHLSKNRKPTHIVNVESPVSSQLEYGALGYTIGERISQSVPLIDGLPRAPNLDELKALGAGMAAAGAVALYHVLGVTPEARNLREDDYRKLETITMGSKEIRETLEKLSTTTEFDHVCLGCPHMSLTELRNVATRVSGKKLKRPIWCFTSRNVHSQAQRKGYVNKITKAGGRVINDTCMVVAPLEEMDVHSVMTDSCKAAHYLPSLCKSKVALGTIDQIVDSST